MKQSVGEILRAYQDRPNAKRIQEIADENGVTANTIRKILRDAGEDVAVFGPGRPKEDNEDPEESEKILKADETLKDETDNVSIKSEPAYSKNQACEIPKVVVELVNERIANINRQIQVYVEQVDSLNTERNELIAFLKGEENGN